MPDSERSTSLTAICVNTEAFAFMFTYGLSAAASTRVSNELGAGNVNQAKHAMSVALKLSIILAIVILSCLGFRQGIWAGLFTGNASMIRSYGVCRGCGWQKLVMFINFGSYYVIGLPIACILAFKFHLYTKGLWMGLTCGLITQCSSLFLTTRLHKWTTPQVLNHGADENNEDF